MFFRLGSLIDSIIVEDKMMTNYIVSSVKKEYTMKNKININLFGNFISVFAVAALFFITGCSKQNEESKEQQQTISESKSSVDSTIIRYKNTDVSKIDVNKDGKVYECQMDYDVISDQPGTCPKCVMKLEEVTVKQAQENLQKSSMN